MMWWKDQSTGIVQPPAVLTSVALCHQENEISRYGQIVKRRGSSLSLLSHYAQNFMHKLAVPSYQYDKPTCLWKLFHLLISKKKDSYSLVHSIYVCKAENLLNKQSYSCRHLPESVWHSCRADYTFYFFLSISTWMMISFFFTPSQTSFRCDLEDSLVLEDVCSVLWI